MKSAWYLTSMLALTSIASADLGSHPLKNALVKGPPAVTSPVRTLVGTSTLVGGSDSCATPDAVAGVGPHAFDNSAATTGAEGQTNGNCLFFGSTSVAYDVWFTWTAPSSGAATLDICAPGSVVDTKVAVYNGAGCPAAASIACNDDGCPTYQSTVVFAVTSGSVYTIQIGTYNFSAGGTGNFTINVVPGIVNDSCSSPTVISGSGPFLYDTTNATTGTEGQTYSRCYIFNTSVIDFDAWYQWTAASTGWMHLNTCAGGLHDLKVAVYAGAGCPAGEPLGCDDDRCGAIGAAASAPFFATSGSVYMLQVGSYVGQAGAPGFFSIDPFTPVANDDCTTPTTVSGPGPHAWDTTDGTTGFVAQNEALCGNEMITFDTWYRWVADCTGNTTVSLCAGSFPDTKIAAYQANGCPVTPALDCNDDFCGGGSPSQITFSALAGTVYMIQIGMWPGEVPGSGTFDITTACPPSVGVGYCFGDGSATACPCGNFSPPGLGQGCLNSFGAGGRIVAAGVASIGADTVTLNASNLSAASVLFFQGTARQNGGLGSPFGDGLRCAGGTVIRLHTHTAVGTPGGATSFYPDTSHGDPTVSVRGTITAAGTRTYQAWYRNIAPFCTPSGFNLTNAVEITWSL